LWPASAHDCWQVTDTGQFWLLRVSPSHKRSKTGIAKLAAAHVGKATLLANGPTTSVHESEHGSGLGRCGSGLGGGLGGGSGGGG
jgi:hypothetical protein